MTTIKKIQKGSLGNPFDQNKETIFPVTKTDAVFDNEDVSLTQRLNEINSNKIGYLHKTISADSNNYYHILGFASIDECNKYIEDPEANKDLVLSDIPYQADRVVRYKTYLENVVPHDNIVAPSFDNVIIGSMNYDVAFTVYSLAYLDNETSLANEKIEVVIERATNGTYSKVGSITCLSDMSARAHINLKQFFVNGAQNFRIKAIGKESLMESPYVELDTIVKIPIEDGLLDVAKYHPNWENVSISNNKEIEAINFSSHESIELRNLPSLLFIFQENDDWGNMCNSFTCTGCKANNDDGEGNLDEVVKEICLSGKILDNFLVDSITFTNFASVPSEKTLSLLSNCEWNKAKFVFSDLVTFDDKVRLLKRYGNVDDVNNSVYCEYEHTLYYSDPVSINGKKYLDNKNTPYTFTIICEGEMAKYNDFTSIVWSISKRTSVELVSDIDTATLTYSVSNDNRYELVAKIMKEDTIIKTIYFGVVFNPYTAQIGDYVFNDGTADHTTTDMTPYQYVIGRCFYIDDYGNRYMCALNDTANNVNAGCQEDESVGVTLSETYSYDIPHIPNLTPNPWDAYFHGNNGDDTGYITGDIGNRATDAEQRHHIQDLLTDINLPTDGSLRLTYGQYNTLQIIAYRNVILSDSALQTNAYVKIPKGEAESEYDEVIHIDANLGSGSNRKSLDALMYFPASYCYAYQPYVPSHCVLADKFKKHHWWLPSSGELAQLLYTQFNRNIDLNLGTSGDHRWYWSSSEISGKRFATVMGQNTPYYKGGSNKATVRTYNVRAITTF